MDCTFKLMIFSSGSVVVLIVYLFLLQEDACPKSPEKIKTVKAKKQMQGKIYFLRVVRLYW